MNQKNNKGITLIALVITIIVLLILAGVTINMVLGDDGIIAQAQVAKKAQQESEDTQAIKLATGEAATSEHLGVLTAGEVEDQLGITFTEENPYNNSIREIKVFGTGTDAKYLPIPKGMAWAYGTIDEGAVVVDGYGNEYVWIPVDGTNVQLELDGNYDNIFEPGYDPYTEEHEIMKESVETYGGFYVGRYETSWNGKQVASVQNAQAMTAGTRLDNGRQASWNGLCDKQKELYNKESDSVVSGMIYGCQWDAIMDWMSDVKNPNSEKTNEEDRIYIKDSTGMGYYNYSTEDCARCSGEEEECTRYGCEGGLCYPCYFDGRDPNCDICGGDLDCDGCNGTGYVYCYYCEGIGYFVTDGGIALTGSDSNYKVKNIYDLAGNLSECTQEDTSSYGYSTRGGSWMDTGASTGASYRFGHYEDEAWPNVGTRIQLCIK